MAADTSPMRVLYAEDNTYDAELTVTSLRVAAPEIEIEVVRTGTVCLAKLVQSRYDVLLLDQRLPDMSGVELLQTLGARGSLLPVVMTTGIGDEALVVQVLRLG